MYVYETLTHDVFRLTIEHYEETLGAQKLRILSNISGEEHDIDNRETALETKKGFLHRPKISWTTVH